MRWRFCGKVIEYQKNPAGQHTGVSLEELIAADLPNVIADAQARQAAQAVEDKRQRAEDRAVADLLRQDLKREQEPPKPPPPSANYPKSF